jgi:hypothetical protein
LYHSSILVGTLIAVVATIRLKLRRGRERWESDERILGSGAFVRETLARLSDQPCVPCTDAAVVFAGLRQRVAATFGTSEREIASPSLRRPGLAARAVLCDLAVCHHGFSLSAVARRLSISRTSVARAIDRVAAVYTESGLTPTDFLER